MCSTLKPSSSIPWITFAGGGEPPVWIWTTCGNLRRCSCGALISMVSTVGAPHMWVTPCSTMSSKICFGSTARRQTCVPPIAVTDHGKHQPLQWNMGRVHRYTGCAGMGQAMMLPTASRKVPRWWYTTPFGRPVVPEV